MIVAHHNALQHHINNESYSASRYQVSVRLVAILEVIRGEEGTSVFLSAPPTLTGFQ